MMHLDENGNRTDDSTGYAIPERPAPPREMESPMAPPPPAPEPPPAPPFQARDDSQVRSHTDLRKHIQAQLELIRSKRAGAPRPDESRPDATPAPSNATYLSGGASPVPEFSTPPPPDSMPGATVIEMRLPAAPFSSASAAPAARAPQPPRPEPEAEEPTRRALDRAEPAPPAAAQDDVLERVNGNLAQLAAPGGILRRIIQEKLTGQLLLISEGESENLQELAYIQDGVLVGCSSLMQTPVRNLLLSAGLISVEDIEEAQRQAGPAVESWLIRQGVVTREQVFETLGVAVREAVVGMMCREFGIFAWKGLRHANPPKALCKTPARELALHYGRNLESFAAIHPEVFNPQRIFRIHESFNLMHSQFRLLPHEWKFLFRVDGKRTVRQIREAIDIPSESLNRCVFVCDLMGFITDCGLAPEEPGAASYTPPPSAPAAFAPARKAPQASAIDDRPKILIVDDSRTVQKMVLMALESMNFNLRTADDGIEALQLIEGEAPDLVLLDVIMPKMDGYKVCSKIRKLLAPAKIPIIMLTAKDGTYNNIRAKLAGATTVVNKPFDPEELRQTIGKHLPVR